MEYIQHKGRTHTSLQNHFANSFRKKGGFNEERRIWNLDYFGDPKSPDNRFENLKGNEIRKVKENTHDKQEKASIKHAQENNKNLPGHVPVGKIMTLNQAEATANEYNKQAHANMQRLAQKTNASISTSNTITQAEKNEVLQSGVKLTDETSKAIENANPNGYTSQKNAYTVLHNSVSHQPSLSFLGLNRKTVILLLQSLIKENPNNTLSVQQIEKNKMIQQISKSTLGKTSAVNKPDFISSVMVILQSTHDNYADRINTAKKAQDLGVSNASPSAYGSGKNHFAYKSLFDIKLTPEGQMQVITSASETITLSPHQIERLGNEKPIFIGNFGLTLYKNRVIKVPVIAKNQVAHDEDDISWWKYSKAFEHTSGIDQSNIEWITNKFIDAIPPNKVDQYVKIDHRGDLILDGSTPERNKTIASFLRSYKKDTGTAHIEGDSEIERNFDLNRIGNLNNGDHIETVGKTSNGLMNLFSRRADQTDAKAVEALSFDSKLPSEREFREALSALPEIQTTEDLNAFYNYIAEFGKQLATQGNEKMNVKFEKAKIAVVGQHYDMIEGEEEQRISEAEYKKIYTLLAVDFLRHAKGNNTPLIYILPVVYQQYKNNTPTQHLSQKIQNDYRNTAPQQRQIIEQQKNDNAILTQASNRTFEYLQNDLGIDLNKKPIVNFGVVAISNKMDTSNRPPDEYRSLGVISTGPAQHIPSEWLDTGKKGETISEEFINMVESLKEDNTVESSIRTEGAYVLTGTNVTFDTQNTTLKDTTTKIGSYNTVVNEQVDLLISKDTGTLDIDKETVVLEKNLINSQTVKELMSSQIKEVLNNSTTDTEKTLLSQDFKTSLVSSIQQSIRTENNGKSERTITTFVDTFLSECITKWNTKTTTTDTYQINDHQKWKDTITEVWEHKNAEIITKQNYIDTIETQIKTVDSKQIDVFKDEKDVLKVTQKLVERTTGREVTINTYKNGTRVFEIDGTKVIVREKEQTRYITVITPQGEVIEHTEYVVDPATMKPTDVFKFVAQVNLYNDEGWNIQAELGKVNKRYGKYGSYTSSIANIQAGYEHSINDNTKVHAGGVLDLSGRKEHAYNFGATYKNGKFTANVGISGGMEGPASVYGNMRYHVSDRVALSGGTQGHSLSNLVPNLKGSIRAEVHLIGKTETQKNEIMQKIVKSNLEDTASINSAIQMLEGGSWFQKQSPQNKQIIKKSLALFFAEKDIRDKFLFGIDLTLITNLDDFLQLVLGITLNVNFVRRVGQRDENIADILEREKTFANAPVSLNITTDLLRKNNGILPLTSELTKLGYKKNEAMGSYAQERVEFRIAPKYQHLVEVVKNGNTNEFGIQFKKFNTLDPTKDLRNYPNIFITSTWKDGHQVFTITAGEKAVDGYEASHQSVYDYSTTQTEPAIQERLREGVIQTPEIGNLPGMTPMYEVAEYTVQQGEDIVIQNGQIPSQYQHLAPTLYSLYAEEINNTKSRSVVVSTGAIQETEQLRTIEKNGPRYVQKFNTMRKRLGKEYFTKNSQLAPLLKNFSKQYLENKTISQKDAVKVLQNNSPLVEKVEEIIGQKGFVKQFPYLTLSLITDATMQRSNFENRKGTYKQKIEHKYQYAMKLWPKMLSQASQITGVPVDTLQQQLTLAKPNTPDTDPNLLTHSVGVMSTINNTVSTMPLSIQTIHHQQETGFITAPNGKIFKFFSGYYDTCKNGMISFQEYIRPEKQPQKRILKKQPPFRIPTAYVIKPKAVTEKSVKTNHEGRENTQHLLHTTSASATLLGNVVQPIGYKQNVVTYVDARPDKVEKTPETRWVAGDEEHTPYNTTVERKVENELVEDATQTFWEAGQSIKENPVEVKREVISTANTYEQEGAILQDTSIIGQNTTRTFGETYTEIGDTWTSEHNHVEVKDRNKVVDNGTRDDINITNEESEEIKTAETTHTRDVKGPWNPITDVVVEPDPIIPDNGTKQLATGANDEPGTQREDGSMVGGISAADIVANIRASEGSA